ncbi:MAG: Hsp20 family protein [Chloroflexi bacterium]|nr:Hsp20 family protein [Chloroflexota bacterium]
MRLPESVDKDKADCHYEQGVLTITFPKVEAKKAKQLKVSVGGQPKAIETRGKAA